MSIDPTTRLRYCQANRRYHQRKRLTLAQLLSELIRMTYQPNSNSPRYF